MNHNIIFQSSENDHLSKTNIKKKVCIQGIILLCFNLLSYASFRNVIEKLDIGRSQKLLISFLELNKMDSTS